MLIHFIVINCHNHLLIEMIFYKQVKLLIFANNKTQCQQQQTAAQPSKVLFFRARPETHNDKTNLNSKKVLQCIEQKKVFFHNIKILT